jgi:hypothetical protein
LRGSPTGSNSDATPLPKSPCQLFARSMRFTGARIARLHVVWAFSPDLKDRTTLTSERFFLPARRLGGDDPPLTCSSFNRSLARPLIAELSASWKRVFGSPERLLGSFERDTLRAVDAFATTLSCEVFVHSFSRWSLTVPTQNRRRDSFLGRPI